MNNSMNDKEWNDWTDKFIAVGMSEDVQGMTKKQLKMFMNLSYIEDDLEAWSGLKEGMCNDLLWNILSKRADAYKLKYTIPLLVFVRLIIDSPNKAERLAEAEAERALDEQIKRGEQDGWAS